MKTTYQKIEDLIDKGKEYYAEIEKLDSNIKKLKKYGESSDCDFSELGVKVSTNKNNSLDKLEEIIKKKRNITKKVNRTLKSLIGCVNSYIQNYPIILDITTYPKSTNEEGETYREMFIDVSSIEKNFKKDLGNDFNSYFYSWQLSSIFDLRLMIMSDKDNPILSQFKTEQYHPNVCAAAIFDRSCDNKIGIKWALIFREKDKTVIEMRDSFGYDENFYWSNENLNGYISEQIIPFFGKEQLSIKHTYSK